MNISWKVPVSNDSSPFRNLRIKLLLSRYRDQVRETADAGNPGGGHIYIIGMTSKDKDD